MIIDYTEELQKTRGYQEIPSNARNISFFAKGVQEKDYDSVKMCMVVKNQESERGAARITAEQLKGMSAELERTLLLKGFRNIELMSIVFTNHPEQEEELKQAEIPYWLVDLKNRSLMIFDNQPANYEAMRTALEFELQQEEQKKKPRRKRTFSHPYAMGLLVLINVLMFLLMDSMGDVYDETYMLRWGADNWKLVFEQGQYYRLLTSMFLHFGFEHLAGNMFMLIIAGKQVEAYMGPFKFLFVYFISGLGASLFSCLHYMRLGENVISAGASGAIFGIMGALAAIALSERNGLFRGQGQRMFIILLLIVFDGYTSSGVDFVAHLGGLFVGMLVTYPLCTAERKHI